MQRPRPAQIEAQVDAFRRRCRAAGLSLTHQREVLYRALLETREHPSPETLYERVRRRIPSISLATVYKNIHTFLEAGLLRELSPHHGTLRLESNLAPHHHIVCVRCKAIVDLEESDLDPVRLRRKLPPGFALQRCNVEFQGLCAACSRDAKKP
jgi:Fur family peroxide stress response transcriptional regulator